MKRILIAFDGTPGAENAVKDLINGGFPKRAEATVLTVADVWVPSEPSHAKDVPPEPPEIVLARQNAAEAVCAAKLTAVCGARLVHQLFPEWNVTPLSVADSPAWGIIFQAKKSNADTIVIGSHGRTMMQNIFLGSVSYKVAAEAHCNVRIVRPRKSPRLPPLRIVIGLDGSKDSLGAADEVLQREWGAGTQIDLVTVIDSRLKSQLSVRSGLADRIKAIDGFEESVQLLLASTAKRFESTEFKVALHTFEGDPKALLLRHAADQNADCIFIGARGSQDSDRCSFGTLASAACYRAHCTIEVIRDR